MDQCYIRRHLFVIPLAVLPVAVAQSIRGSSSAYPYEIGGTVSSPVKIILAVLIFGMFLIAFFSLYLRKCLQDSSVETHRPHAIPNNQRTRLKFPCGLDRSVVESFPVFLYSDVKVLKIGKGALECAVCISEFADDEKLRFLPKCHHVFHPDCIDAWLASHTTCPVCRADLTKANLEGDSEFHHELTHSQIGESRIEIGSQDHHLINIEHERAAPIFPRSHSTGHSLVPLGENCERYTLRLPEEVRKQIVTLKRAKSCGCGVDFPMEGSSRRGWRGGGGVHGGGRRWNPDRLCGRTDLWNFTVTRMPVFIAKSDSAGKSDPAQSSSSNTTPV
ncbi:hypothetical protein L2E82_34365 [Cichorium intybus]|uniref:Uncharacterized protein n=1 Tax=Cichorium intybus TaxID=13427 RepID=A0ACB9BM98_CICIN|nr:hypothetical protein L2E82_34365 [Cichorium intybus]